MTKSMLEARFVGDKFVANLKSQTSLWPEKFCFPKKPEMINSVQSIENYFIQIAFLLYDDILERNQDLFGNFSFVLKPVLQWRPS